MDTKTRAEKLYQRIIAMGYPPKAEEMYEWILETLDEAVREAVRSSEAYGAGQVDGFSAAKAKAAGIAEGFECNSRWIPEGIAERIRAMEDK